MEARGPAPVSRERVAPQEYPEQPDRVRTAVAAPAEAAAALVPPVGQEQMEASMARRLAPGEPAGVPDRPRVSRARAAGAGAPPSWAAAAAVAEAAPPGTALDLVPSRSQIRREQRCKAAQAAAAATPARSASRLGAEVVEAQAARVRSLLVLPQATQARSSAALAGMVVLVAPQLSPVPAARLPAATAATAASAFTSARLAERWSTPGR